LVLPSSCILYNLQYLVIKVLMAMYSVSHVFIVIVVVVMVTVMVMIMKMVMCRAAWRHCHRKLVAGSAT
jgi:hypothetical protein